MPELTEERIWELFGDPRETHRRLVRFSESARALSSDYPRMIEKYPDQWVAVHEGEVLSHAAQLDELLEAIDAADVPRKEVLIRFIESHPRILML